MLGVVMASIIMGIAMSVIREKVANLIKVVLEFTSIMMIIIQVVIWLTPIGVFFLILAKFLEMPDILNVFARLGMYLLTVSAGRCLFIIIIGSLLIKSSHRHLYSWIHFPASHLLPVHEKESTHFHRSHGSSYFYCPRDVKFTCNTPC
jgi:Na+/H+-dicarboxylate symporter